MASPTKYRPGSPAVQPASAAGVVGIGVYAIAIAVSFWLPQPEEAFRGTRSRRRSLPE